MTAAQLATRVRYLTKQDSVSLSNADLLLLANTAKNEIASVIADHDIKGNYFILPTLYSLTADTREYALSDNLLGQIYSIEVSFTTATPLEYKLAYPDDFRRHGLGRTEANIIGLYSNNKPAYEIQRRKIYLLSGTIIAVTDGLRIRYRLYPADLTDATATTDLAVDPSSSTFGMPRQFHELWARRMVIEWKGMFPGSVPLSPLDLKYEEDFQKQLDAIFDNDMSGEYIATIPNDDGSDL